MRGFLPGLLLISYLGLSPSLPPVARQPEQSSVAPRHGRWVAAWQDLEGFASWYSTQDPGVVPLTANTEPFDDQALTCAMWGVPFNTQLRVTNLVNGRSVIVRVNDRGPAEDLVLAQQRVIDLTKTAFAAIADPGQGLIRVRVELARPLLSSTH